MCECLFVNQTPLNVSEKMSRGLLGNKFSETKGKFVADFNFELALRSSSKFGMQIFIPLACYLKAPKACFDCGCLGAASPMGKKCGGSA